MNHLPWREALWNARPALSNLDQARETYIAPIGPDMQELLARGIELIGFAFNGEDTPLRSPHQHLALWRMADASQATELEATVETAGWHDYFEQVNARGELLSPPDAFAHMIAAGDTTATS